MELQSQRRALVRPPGLSFARAISSTGAPIDVGLAQSQHAEYCRALVAAGVRVEALLPDERFPDSCFMQDPALVLDGVAIVARLAAPSRQGEEEALAALLAERYPPLARIRPPATLEGGDVLVLPDRILVGLSDRSNAAGVAQLGAAVAGAHGDKGVPRPVTGVQVQGFLHLLSGVTYLGRGTVLAVQAFAALPELTGYRFIIVPPDEEYACNALAIDGNVVFPAGYGKTAALLRQAGFEVLETPVSEFAKADGGVTCLSLLL